MKNEKLSDQATPSYNFTNYSKSNEQNTLNSKTMQK